MADGRWSDGHAIEAAQRRAAEEDRERFGEPKVIPFPEPIGRPTTSDPPIERTASTPPAVRPSTIPTDPPGTFRYYGNGSVADTRSNARPTREWTPERELNGLRALRKVILAKLNR